MGTVVPSDAAVYISRLRPGGAEYEVLESVELAHERHVEWEEMKMDREQALDVALGQIERNFGKGAVMKMSDQAHVSVGSISTGSLSLDLALGIGGLPSGRIVEIFGPESSGKTTLVYHVIAEAQRRGGICAFIDAEHAMDPTYAKRIGVNIDELLVSQPDTGEQALEITELLIRSGALSVVAIDSVAALTPKAEIEGEMGDSHVGLQARLMSQALRKLAGTLNRTDTICIFTNQLREKIGVMFGNPEVTPGGRALKFYASVRLDIRRIETLKDGVEAVGNRCRVKVAKNKVAPPFKQAEFDIMYGEGISWEGTVLDTGLDRKIVTKSGSYFSLGDERLGQGRQNATAFLKEHPDLVQTILQGIQATMAPGQIVSARLLPQLETCRRCDVRGGSRSRSGGRDGERLGAAWPRASRRSSPSRAAACASISTASRGASCPQERSSRHGSQSGSSSTGRGRGRCVASRSASKRSPSPRGALSRRDHSVAGLTARLERRGVAPQERARALETLERAGYVDDGRFAAVAGDPARRPRLRRRGDPPRPRTARAGGEPIAAALAGLEPESERARGLIARLGPSPKTARRLAAKGFSADAVEAALGDQDILGADG